MGTGPLSDTGRSIVLDLRKPAGAAAPRDAFVQMGGHWQPAPEPRFGRTAPATPTSAGPAASG